MTAAELKRKIDQSIQAFSQGNLTANALQLFQTLGYNTERHAPLDKPTFAEFRESYIQPSPPFNEKKALVTEWKYVDLLFQLSKEEVLKQTSLFTTKKVNRTAIEAYLFFTIELTNELSGDHYSRTELAHITREVNRLFAMPVMILFKYGNALTLSVINRRLHKRDDSRDVLEKVTLIKDIQIQNPHRAHIEILFDLSFDELKNKFNFTNFVELHNAWQKSLDTKELNKRFYRELANWYFWAVQNVEFPADAETERDVRNATNVIRLITRLIFVWFLKEKGLIPDELFNQNRLRQILKFIDDNNTTYYKAIFQNLFFATLNTEMGKRQFRNRAKKTGDRDQHYMIHNVFRYEDYFSDPEETLTKYFTNIPFLNGGLFECLDIRDENTGKQARTDGFSDRKDNVLRVPDELFFSDEQEIDLNNVYGTKNKTYRARGIINLLNSYKFTIVENTPVEEEVALDPELLGKVFENLLASYNPETGSTARKQTGSFYTPREIVTYMVDESLIAYLQTKLASSSETIPSPQNIPSSLPEEGQGGGDKRLCHLFSYTYEPHQFNPKEVDILIDAIDSAKILDPACGSGAFPMGILHKLVYILSKLDPNNQKWRQRQINKVMEVPDVTVREKLIEDIEQAFQSNKLDYGRKLYLIENAIFGVDIQPIAVQIAKLRFFISLIVDQKISFISPPLAGGAGGGENLGIRPLPNLETKFVAANTLIGIERPQQLMLRNPDIDKKEAELKKVRERHFTARTPQTKEKYRKEDETLRKEISQLLSRDGFTRDVTEKLANWSPYDQNASADFFDPEWMFGVTEGFDIVIGNPPYVEHKKLKGISSELKKHYSTYSGTADLYVYFYENGINNLREKGTLVYITSNKFIKTSYGEHLRKYFSNFNINEIIDFTEVHVFEALVSSCIFSVSKNNNSSNKIKVAFVNDSLFDFSSVDAFIDKNKFYLKQSNISGNIWQLENETKLALKKKIENGSVTMNKIDDINIYRGVTTGYNPAFIIDDEKRKELIKEDKANKTIIKPLLQGRNIRKWIYQESNDYLLQTGYNTDIKKNYPIIFEHLKQFKNELEVRADQGINWWNLRACKYYSEFEKEKIIWGLTADKWAFAYDNENHFLPSNGYILTSKVIPVKYLLALMNSKLIEFYFGFIGIMTAGGAFTLKYETVIEFPIKEVEEVIQHQFITLVDQIIAAKQKNPTADTSTLEREIDQMVYKLYGLTPEEITIVEGKR